MKAASACQRSSAGPAESRQAAGTRRHSSARTSIPRYLELTGQRSHDPLNTLTVSVLLSYFLGKRDSINRDALYWHYPHSRNEAAIRAGRYKLLHRFKTDQVELYDLKTNLGEQQDLSKEKPELTARLLGQLKQWQERVGARFE